MEFTDYSAAEISAAIALAPILDDTTDGWWYVRKAPEWRIRLRPLPDETSHAIDDVRDMLAAQPQVHRATVGIYEPETHAFGGALAMAGAHRLFCWDSRQILQHAIRDLSQRSERSILLCTALLRAAGLDWYEQGDVWARVSANRRPQADDPVTPNITAAARRLISVDTSRESSLLGPSGSLEDMASWFTGFRKAGTELAALDRAGNLNRGLRAVLAHHVIFHWNRIGLTYDEQRILAAAASRTAFDS